MELTPDKASYSPGETITVDLSEPADTEAGVIIWRLFDKCRQLSVAQGSRTIQLSELPDGGYGIEYTDASAHATVAVEVASNSFVRPRYGFVSQFDNPSRVEATKTWFRRLHLNVAQFYDWGYRHDQLLPPTTMYEDALGQHRDLSVVNEMASQLNAVGVTPLGYSALYAVGNSHAGQWADSLLLRGDGQPYRLGDDFLTLVDPAAPRWLPCYVSMLSEVMEATTLQGFHLDQYGWPKVALRGDGAMVDVADSFRDLVRAVHEALPQARLIFNSVSGFAAGRTAEVALDATYIEVWPPCCTLGELGDLVTWARAIHPGRPVIMAAYLSCYANEPGPRANRAAALCMATILSHGATHLLLGEDGCLLTDPYYPKNYRLNGASVQMFVTWYDFLVRWGDLLFDVGQEDVTGFMTDDVLLQADDARFSARAEPGTVWVRVVRVSGGWVIHLINLASQSETVWDAGKQPTTEVTGMRLHWASISGYETASWASPGQPVAANIHSQMTGDRGFLSFDLPDLHDWALIYIARPSGQTTGER